MSDNNDKPTSAYIKAEAATRHAEAQKFMRRAEIKRDALQALAASTQHGFGLVLDALASVCKINEDLAGEVAALRGQVDELQQANRRAIT